MALSGAAKREHGGALFRWLLTWVAASFVHAALSIPAMILILGLMYGAEWLAAIVAWAVFFPCFVLFELGLLGWETPLDGPLDVMIPLNSLLWPLVLIPLASGMRRLPAWFVERTKTEKGPR